MKMLLNYLAKPILLIYQIFILLALSLLSEGTSVGLSEIVVNPLILTASKRSLTILMKLCKQKLSYENI